MVDIHEQVEMYGGRGIHYLGQVRLGAYMLDIHEQVEMYGGDLQQAYLNSSSKIFFEKKSEKVSKNAEFHADFESVEKVLKK